MDFYKDNPLDFPKPLYDVWDAYWSFTSFNDFKKSYSSVLVEYNITPKDFVIKQNKTNLSRIRNFKKQYLPSYKSTKFLVDSFSYITSLHGFPTNAEINRILNLYSFMLIKHKDCFEYMLLKGGEDRAATFLDNLVCYCHLFGDYDLFFSKHYVPHVDFHPYYNFKGFLPYLMYNKKPKLYLKSLQVCFDIINCFPTKTIGLFISLYNFLETFDKENFQKILDLKEQNIDLKNYLIQNKDTKIRYLKGMCGSRLDLHAECINTELKAVVYFLQYIK